MKKFRSVIILVLVLVALFSTGGSLAHRDPQTRPTATAREDAYRANNIGVALLEQFKHKEGADSFRRALQLDPGLVTARINLRIALYTTPDLPAAKKN